MDMVFYLTLRAVLYMLNLGSVTYGGSWRHFLLTKFFQQILKQPFQLKGGRGSGTLEVL